MEQKSNTFTQIYDIVRQIPYGKVATYGQIAELAGNKRLSRVVGYALHVNPDPDGIPCYRVVNLSLIHISLSMCRPESIRLPLSFISLSSWRRSRM